MNAVMRCLNILKYMVYRVNMLCGILILGERQKDLRCITSLDSFQDL